MWFVYYFTQLTAGSGSNFGQKKCDFDPWPSLCAWSFGRLWFLLVFGEWIRSYIGIICRLSVKFTNSHWLFYLPFYKNAVSVIQKPVAQADLRFIWRIKNQLDATCYFIVLLIGWTCFGHYYAHHQEHATVMSITTSVVSFLVCCMLEVRCG